MPAPFPHHYEVTLEAGADGSGALTAPERPPIVGGAPPQFDGRPEWWSPEHLLLSSVGLCLMTTLQALAARARIPLTGYLSRVSGTLDKTAAGLAFTAIEVAASMAVPEELRPRLEALIGTAEKHCIVSNALKVPVTVKAVVTALASPAAEVGSLATP
jgi:organic hydroperoxide reductase OsmC/OhrA